MPPRRKPEWKQVPFGSIVVPPNSPQARLPEASIRVAIQKLSPHLSTLELLHPIVVDQTDMSLCGGHRTYRIIRALADDPGRLTWVVSTSFQNTEMVAVLDELVCPLLGSPTDEETISRYLKAADQNEKWLRFMWVDPTREGIADFLGVSRQTVQRVVKKGGEAGG
ncbi:MULTISPECIES: hypothetical protein [unclassified Thioalkalivibrio]|jgi:hypothetical protein|uniref:hypothetical protein n=1 Tax=unclassified Thioalkalivibrio TaxID=2621013 RepID=UPI001E339EF5|nr:MULTISPECIES: hypothetical protein [unclassified Thioalkalivibrio]